ncbi:hypothetical protein ACKWMY_27595, partial [Serratia sp. J2]|uniref:hypothetical protein n=1 Tax=Serratia sp. J2 TaxID=3386551 RepID=UPI003916D368
MSKFLRHITWDRAALMGIAALSIFLVGSALAEEAPASRTIPASLEFDSSFLNVDNEASVDLSRFAIGASALPGTYKT